MVLTTFEISIMFQLSNFHVGLQIAFKDFFNMFLHHVLTVKSSGSWRKERESFHLGEKLRRVHSENSLLDNLATGIIGFQPISSKRIGLLSATLDSKAKSLPTNFQRSEFFPLTVYQVPRKLQNKILLQKRNQTQQ